SSCLTKVRVAVAVAILSGVEVTVAVATGDPPVGVAVGAALPVLVGVGVVPTGVVGVRVAVAVVVAVVNAVLVVVAVGVIGAATVMLPSVQSVPRRIASGSRAPGSEQVRGKLPVASAAISTSQV